jgi:phosphatidylglycerophosphatase A
VKSFRFAKFTLRNEGLTTSICKLIISGGGFGYIPILKGTTGTLVGLAIYLWLVKSGIWGPWEIAAGGSVLFSLLSLALGKWAEVYYQRKDPPVFILDEMAGIFTAFLFVPSLTGWWLPINTGITQTVLIRIILIFALFRLFDGIKPFPIRQSQTLPAGLGILVDDLLAGILTNLCFQGCYWLCQALWQAQG